MEIIDGNLGEKNGVTNNPKHKSARLFGFNGKDDNALQRPSKILVRDCPLITDSVDFSKTELLYTEYKTENSIDRITAKANPRTFEKVPKGAKFKMELVLSIFQDPEWSKHNDMSEPPKEDETLQQTFRALKMLQSDYLGMGGSRGNGQVKIHLKKEDILFIENYDEDKKPYEVQIPEELK